MLLEPIQEHLLIGKLYFKLLDFEKALAAIERGLKAADAGDSEAWAKLSLFRARILKELGHDLELGRQLEALEKRGSEDFVRSGLNFLLGRRAAERGDLEDADRLFEIAEVSALDKEDEFNAGYGRCQVLLMKSDWQRAFDGMEALETRLEKGGSFPEIEILIHLSKVRLAWELKNIVAAEAALEKSKSLARSLNGLFFHLQGLVTEAFFRADNSELLKARRCWELIERLAPAEMGSTLSLRVSVLKRRLELLDEAPLIQLGVDEARAVLRYKSETLDLTTLPQLRKLLEFFAESPGRVFSKEEICGFLWGESYHPLRHDNKIYVTIRRLRSLLSKLQEQNFHFVFSRHDGYMFNSEIRFQRCRLNEIIDSKKTGLNLIRPTLNASEAR